MGYSSPESSLSSLLPDSGDEDGVVDDVGVIIKSSEIVVVKVSLVLILFVTATGIVVMVADADVTVGDGTRPTTQQNNQSHHRLQIDNMIG